MARASWRATSVRHQPLAHPGSPAPACRSSVGPMIFGRGWCAARLTPDCLGAFDVPSAVKSIVPSATSRFLTEPSSEE